MKKYWPLILILILAAVFRVYHNFDISIWHDEAFSALLIRYSWPEMFSRLAIDVHPPMYYIALRLWHYIFGDTVVALRGFSILFGVGTVWGVWLFVKTAFQNEKAALWAALLLALNPYIVDFSTEARMYTFGAFFAVLAAYFLTKALHEQKKFYDGKSLNMPNLPTDIKLQKNFLWHYLGFALCTAIIILTHYYLLFTAAALCLYALIFHIYHYRGELKRYSLLVSSYLLIIASFLPWLKIFISQVKSVGGGYWIPPMDIWSIPGTLWTFLLGIPHNNSNPDTLKWMVVVVLFSIFFFYRFLRKSQPWEKWLVLLATIAPFCGSILFVILARLKGSESTVFQERYFLFAGVFYIIALAIWLSEIKIKWLASSVFVLYCLFNVYAFSHNWEGLNISNKPGMKAAAKYLVNNVEPGQQVFLGTSFEFFNYKYYESTYFSLPNPPLLYTGGRGEVSQMSPVEGSAILSNADLAPTFEQHGHSGDTEWIIWTYAFGSNKPSLPKNWIQIDEKEFPDVRPYVGTSIYVTQYRVN